MTHQRRAFWDLPPKDPSQELLPSIQMSVESVFSPASFLRATAEKAHVRKQMAETMFEAATAGERMVSFDVGFGEGVRTHNGIPVRDLIAELSALGYECKLNVDSSDRTYHLDISF